MKTIPLTNGGEAIVDDADYPELSKYGWFLYRQDGHCAVARADGQSTIYMHRAITAAQPGRVVLHGNRNNLDNRRSNLRICGPGDHRYPSKPKPRPKPKTKPRKMPKEPKVRVTLNDRIEAVKVKRMREWLYYCRRNWTEPTTERYAGIIRRFCMFLEARDGKPVDPASLCVSDIEQWLDHILSKHCRNTANGCLVGLKSFFTWQTRHYGTENIGARIPELTPEPPKQRVLTDAEYHAVLDVCNPLEKDVIQFLAHTGLRREEFRWLEWSNITSDLNLIRISGKGRKERVVPLSAVAKDILTKYADRSIPIPFVARYGGCPVTLNRLCERLAKRAGIPKFGPHAARHYFCTRMVRANVSIKKVSKILGHSSLAITEEVYCHLLPEDLIGLTDVLVD